MKEIHSNIIIKRICNNFTYTKSKNLFNLNLKAYLLLVLIIINLIIAIQSKKNNIYPPISLNTLESNKYYNPNNVYMNSSSKYFKEVTSFLLFIFLINEAIKKIKFRKETKNSKNYHKYMINKILKIL